MRGILVYTKKKEFFYTMNDKNKILVRCTGHFRYKNPVTEFITAKYPGDKIILHLGLHNDRVQLAHILHPKYLSKGFILIEQKELDKLKDSNYYAEYTEIANAITPEQAQGIEKFNEYTPIETNFIPLFNQDNGTPRLTYEGVEEITSEESSVATEVLEPVVEEPVVEEPVVEEVEVIEKAIHFAQSKEYLESVHYKKLHKIADEEDGIEYETKATFIEFLLNLDTNEFERLYNAYLNE
jgi:hypothetical protein